MWQFLTTVWQTSQFGAFILILSVAVMLSGTIIGIFKYIAVMIRGWPENE